MGGPVLESAEVCWFMERFEGAPESAPAFMRREYEDIMERFARVSAEWRANTIAL